MVEDTQQNVGSKESDTLGYFPGHNFQLRASAKPSFLCPPPR